MARPLFAYGTLQDSDILGAVLGRRLPDSAFLAARLAGFAALYYPGEVYPALAPRPEAVAEGLLIQGLDDADRAALDAFEGDQYRREQALVDTAQGPILADLYLPARDLPETAPLWTLSLWRERHKPAVLAQETALGHAARLGLAQGKREAR